ncbi:MAG: FAD-dependent monooxygenase [Thiotrichales bacterium]|nr:FAD-dependent monooxygenase [Thiotrichales bacterium]
MISGAGVAGLTAAIWLGRAGFKPVIIEKSPEIRADGYIISLSHKSYHYANELGLLPKLVERNTGIKHSSYHHRSGKTMLLLDYQNLFEEVDIVQIMRDELEMVLYEEARDLAEFRFAVSASAIEQDNNKVYVSFDNGTQDEFDVVIGADGLHSVTRELAFDKNDFEKIYLGRFSAAYKLDNVIGLEDKFENHMEKNRYMCVYTTGKGDLATAFIWKDRSPRAPGLEQRAVYLKQAFSNPPALVQKILDQCPENEPFYMDPLMQIRMQQWHKGRVVLTGDAAHSLTLLSGQGASSAFWGASTLAQSLIEHDPDTAFRIYLDDLHPVIERIQPAVRKAAKWYIPGATLPWLVRDSLMTCLPNMFFQKYFKNKYTSA